MTNNNVNKQSVKTALTSLSPSQSALTSAAAAAVRAADDKFAVNGKTIFFFFFHNFLFELRLWLTRLLQLQPATQYLI